MPKNLQRLLAVLACATMILVALAGVPDLPAAHAAVVPDIAVAAVLASVAGLEPLGLSVKETAAVERCGVSTVWERLAAGEYEAIKDGAKTLITVKSIQKRREGLLPATYKPFKSRPNHRRREDQKTVD
jgi:hypothetical protein